MKLQLAPVITSCSSKASALGLSSDAFYSLMTSPSANRDKAMVAYTPTMRTTSLTVYAEL